MSHCVRKTGMGNALSACGGSDARDDDGVLVVKHVAHKADSPALSPFSRSRSLPQHREVAKCKGRRKTSMMTARRSVVTALREINEEADDNISELERDVYSSFLPGIDEDSATAVVKAASIMNLGRRMSSVGNKASCPTKGVDGTRGGRIKGRRSSFTGLIMVSVARGRIGCLIGGGVCGHTGSCVV